MGSIVLLSSQEKLPSAILPQSYGVPLGLHWRCCWTFLETEIRSVEGACEALCLGLTKTGSSWPAWAILKLTSIPFALPKLRGSVFFLHFCSACFLCADSLLSLIRPTAGVTQAHNDDAVWAVLSSNVMSRGGEMVTTQTHTLADIPFTRETTG